MMRQLIFIIGFLAFVCTQQGLAETVKEVRIMVDVSGSMLQNDPDNVRRSALRLLTGLLPKGSRAGVWLFAEQAKRLLLVATVGPRWREQALKKSAAIHSRGQRTHIERALREVIQGWQAGSEVQKNIILLTDGVVDVSRDARQSQRSRQRIVQQLLPRLSQLGVKVHTVALSAEADHELLQQLSAGSGGLYLKAERADQLQRIFLHLLESAAPPDSVPLTGNRFVVDESIEEVTLLLFRSQDGEAPRLIRPDGVPLQADALGLKWRSENGFDLLTMEAPMLGEWQIVAVADPDNRAMVVTNLKLQVEAIAPLMLPNSPFVLQAHLQSEGKRINKIDFLQMVELSLQPKVDAVAPERQVFPRHKAGLYQLEQSLPDEGSYELSVIADGGTFARVWHQQVQLSWPLNIELKWDAEAKRYQLNVRTKIEFRPLLASSPLLYQKEKGADETWLPRNLERLDEQVWQSSVAAGAQLKLELSLKTDPLRTVTLPLIEVPALPMSVENPVVEKTAPETEAPAEGVAQEPAEEVPSEQVNWLQVALIVLLINLVLAAGFFFARRYWHAQSTDIEWPESQGETA